MAISRPVIEVVEPEDEGTVTWRVIPLERTTAARAMALEEALVESVSGRGPPTVRFWMCEPSAVTLGRFQDATREVDLDLCSELGVDVVRRMSGGGTVYHDRDREFVYSVTAPELEFPHNVVRAYSEVLGLVMGGLSIQGIDPWVKDDNNVMVGDLKVSGASQRRSAGVLQVHGTVLWDVDEGTMFSLLRARPGMEAGKATPSRHHPVTGVKAQCGASLEDTYASVRRALLLGRVHYDGSWTDAEIARADDLVVTKYGTEDWNLVL
jgi:lipoate-protein ligase A